jgi:hypothetical protein
MPAAFVPGGGVACFMQDTSSIVMHRALPTIVVILNIYLLAIGYLMAFATIKNDIRSSPSHNAARQRCKHRHYPNRPPVFVTQPIHTSSNRIHSVP